MIDLKAVTLEIGRLSKEKAQLELRTKQLEEKRVELKGRLVELGVEENGIEAEIERLETSIRARLATAGSMCAEVQSGKKA